MQVTVDASLPCAIPLGFLCLTLSLWLCEQADSCDKHRSRCISCYLLYRIIQSDWGRWPWIYVCDWMWLTAEEKPTVWRWIRLMETPVGTNNRSMSMCSEKNAFLFKKKVLMYWCSQIIVFKNSIFLSLPTCCTLLHPAVRVFFDTVPFVQKHCGHCTSQAELCVYLLCMKST